MFMYVLLAAKTVTSTLSGAGNEVQSGLAEKIAGFFDFVISQVPGWIAAFIVVVLTIIVAKITKSAVESRISDQVDEEHQEVYVLSGRVTYVAVMTVGITVALKIAGIDLTTILAAVAFGIGFALRSFIANFFSGIYILVSRQFAIGDFIQIGSTVGKVIEIQSRATILKTYDGYKVIVPNADIFTKQVISLTTNPVRRIKIPLYISYDTDINYAIKIALKTIKKHPKILKKPGPTIIVSDYGDSTIDLIGRAWVGSRDGWFKIRSDLMHSLWDAFTRAGIVVPYNIMHVETGQDTAQWEHEYAELTKQEMEKMRLTKEKKLAEKNATRVANPPNPMTAANGNAQTIAPATPPLIPAAEAPLSGVDPPGAYDDLVDIDQNG